MRAKPGPPMSLANMRANGVRAVTATCQACGHAADVNVDALPETLTVPRSRQTLSLRPAARRSRPAPHGIPPGALAFQDFRPPERPPMS